MSTSRYLNWSRPSPGRHHPLRKQISCFESFSGGGRSLSVNNLASVSADKSVDFATFVTAATIHKNRFQNYHTYHQAHHRGTIITADTGTGGSGSSTLVSDGGPPRATPRRRPASAHMTSSSSSSPSSSVLSGLTMAKKVNTHESRKVLTKQLSLDHPGALGPAAGHAWTTAASRAPSIGGTSSVGVDHHGADPVQSPKVCASSGIKKRPPGLSVKNDIESSEHIKKALKQGKDSRINIKIFLGQTVQQDSSDTGHSDTECSPSLRNQPHHPSSQSPQPPPQQQQQQQQQEQPQEQQGNQKAEAENSQPEGASKPKQQQSSGGSGRNSSLAQRSAQFQANRQNSETAERRPPLVRAMSAPIRPIDNDSKFLQSKKKTRKKKILRERDEINECDEDDFDEETLKLNTTNSKNTLAAAAGGPRSRSVLGGACDIETLVSLLSSGGSDSEKEDTVPTHGADSTGNSSTNFNINISSALKSRAPMLKKAGKSVSFQETELKQTAGLNRDYYQPGHRKPPSLQPFANRIRRSQQLANTLNAFQKKNLTEGTKSDEDKDQHSSDESKDNAKSSDSIPPSSNPTKTVQASSPSSSDAKTGDAGSGASGQDGGLVDGQTPKERECYRLFQKMSNMGLSVSYDTILRGMLTPTELRVLQKQRTKLQKQQESSRQNSSETEKENDSSDNSKSEGTANASDLSSLLSSGPELEVVSGPLPVLAEQTVEQ
ncbi:protein hunchback-like [Ochlerotatus camptorhynchus]|uniref:protein hunchback-like n=1 Tax=Ochlerotatus camptorhynchus TaxID=644619 RepID=UPI0031D0D712